jgi:uncharacterized membrane protein (UPF0127 family)
MKSNSRIIRIQSLKNQEVIADKCLVAECALDRLKGLLGRSGLEPGEGMLFPKCNSVHMWFMRFSIDVVFVRKSTRSDGTSGLKVSKKFNEVRPWRLTPLFDWRATDTLELPRGTIERLGIEVGDELCIS